MSVTGHDRRPVPSAAPGDEQPEGCRTPLSGALSSRWRRSVAGLTLSVLAACGTPAAAPGQSDPMTQSSAAGGVGTTSDGGPTMSPSQDPTSDDTTPTGAPSSIGSGAPDPGVPTAVTSDLPGLPGRAAVTLTGTVSEGVERGCIALVDEGGTALATLLGFDQQAHPFGSRITVTGRWATDRVSFCQQGPLLDVQSVTSAA